MSAAFLMTDDQWEQIEKVQRRATRTILGIKKWYGDGVPRYHDRIDTLKLMTIEERIKFKCQQHAERHEFDSRYNKYFILRDKLHSMNTRESRPYFEPIYNTNRRRDSPVMRMISYLNGLWSTPLERLNKCRNLAFE